MKGNRQSPLPPKKNPPLYRSFAYALSGIGTAFFRERNLRVHLGVGAGALYFAGVYGLSRGEWAVLLLAIGFVIACELFNTAVERLADLASAGTFHPLAKIAKDTAAGGVLVSALVSVGVGIALFGDPQRLLPTLQVLARRPLPTLMLAAAVLLLTVFPTHQSREQNVPPGK